MNLSSLEITNVHYVTENRGSIVCENTGALRKEEMGKGFLLQILADGSVSEVRRYFFVSTDIRQLRYNHNSYNMFKFIAFVHKDTLQCVTLYCLRCTLSLKE